MRGIAKGFYAFATLFWIFMSLSSLIDQNWPALIFFTLAGLSTYIFYRGK